MAAQQLEGEESDEAELARLEKEAEEAQTLANQKVAEAKRRRANTAGVALKADLDITENHHDETRKIAAAVPSPGRHQCSAIQHATEFHSQLLRAPGFHR